MKKILFLAIVMLSVCFANAAVTVTQNGKTVTYKNGSTLTVNGKTDAAIDYNGVSVFIPKGQMLLIRPTKAGGVILQGDQFSGIVVNNHTLSAEGFTVLVVDPKTQDITIQEGTVNVADQNGNLQTFEQGSTLSAQEKTTPKAEPSATQDAPVATKPVATENTDEQPIPDFVSLEAITDTIAYQQATQDVERPLSPSAPRE